MNIEDTYAVEINRLSHWASFRIIYGNCFFKSNLLDRFFTLLQLLCSVWIIWTNSFYLYHVRTHL